MDGFSITNIEDVKAIPKRIFILCVIFTSDGWTKKRKQNNLNDKKHSSIMLPLVSTTEAVKNGNKILQKVIILRGGRLNGLEWGEVIFFHVTADCSYHLSIIPSSYNTNSHWRGQTYDSCLNS